VHLLASKKYGDKSSVLKAEYAFKQLSRKEKLRRLKRWE